MYAASNFGIRAAVRRVEIGRLNDKIHEVCLWIHKNNNWRIKFQFRDLFINFLHKQALYPYAVTKPDFSDFGWSFEHHISETNSVTPQFFYIFDMSNP